MKTPAHATIDFENENHEFPARMMEENTRAQCNKYKYMPINDWAYDIIYAQFETEHNQYAKHLSLSIPLYLQIVSLLYVKCAVRQIIQHCCFIIIAYIQLLFL